MRKLVPMVAGAALWSLAACGGGEPPASETALPSAADTVETALALYDAAAFDTITWESPGEAVVRGSVVFSYSCRKCHGSQGYGDGGFVTQGDTIRPPDFHQPDWRFTTDLDGLRRQIFTGTAEGMPHWGLEGLKHRDIDAVARFIQDRLTGT
jgi:mono/diheme cytochrome c family protein